MWISVAIAGVAGAALSSLVGAVVLLVALDIVVRGAGVQPDALQYLSLSMLILFLPAAGAVAGVYFDALCLPRTRSAMALRAGGLAGFLLCLSSSKALDSLLQGVELVLTGGLSSLVLFFLHLCSGVILCGGVIVVSIGLAVALVELAAQWFGYATLHRLGVPLPSIRMLLVVFVLSLSVHLCSDLMIEVLKQQMMAAQI